jgi:hypothetical protein
MVDGKYLIKDEHKLRGKTGSLTMLLCEKCPQGIELAMAQLNEAIL